MDDDMFYGQEGAEEDDEEDLDDEDEGELQVKKAIDKKGEAALLE